jgi:hypothetical protein
MISLWAFVREADVEAYAATLLLPSYLSHLCFGPFKFSAQGENCDGQEPLRITLLGEGRLEEFALQRTEHALAMIRFVCPGIDASRIQLPRDDASWHWTTAADSPGSGPPAESMRIYFAPTTRTLRGVDPLPPCADAYVSVSRGHVFIGRAVVESYIQAWLKSLGIQEQVTQVDFATPSAGIEFLAGAIGGQLFLSDQVIAEDLMHFARLDKALARLGHSAQLDLETASEDHSGVFADGVYIGLRRDTETSQDRDAGHLPA